MKQALMAALVLSMALPTALLAQAVRERGAHAVWCGRRSSGSGPARRPRDAVAAGGDHDGTGFQPSAGDVQAPAAGIRLHAFDW